ncbi:hypoxanthine phosphoribosyltransferase [Segniliparus rugosus]|uniref:Hypoxanthine phosphoribosyltransferase n=1 Tax=Segniliparus rugosus (strain ATCC BAA-974 / DSM 45345 / CCUG 50838 / CIP 108380 / JCM 13579 / CDC 945) TaxID=679197 RepID=E5XVH9_SEGRC|nr:hypoxanthine phosphoribosyltransferase [Segniliparus rugosus]EFV11646.1 hypoxanthine phosphoribosyltransferase [Segniliparus rugosus ATCC BAA-974]
MNEPAVAVTAAQANWYDTDVPSVVLTEEQIATRTVELAQQIAANHPYRPGQPRSEDLLLVTVLKGAVMFTADLARALPIPSQLEFMAVSSYGAATKSSGVVRIVKDLDRDIRGRDVLVVEDVVDSGLTLSWLLRHLAAREPKSLEVCALLRKPEALEAEVKLDYIGFDIPNVFVVGYGLDFDERYRDLPFLGDLDPSAVERP